MKNLLLSSVVIVLVSLCFNATASEVEGFITKLQPSTYEFNIGENSYKGSKKTLVTINSKKPEALKFKDLGENFRAKIVYKKGKGKSRKVSAIYVLPM